MNIIDTSFNTWQKYRIPVVLITVVIAVLVGYGLRAVVQQQRQAQVAERGTEVMPFALDKTTHHFERTDDGGIQTVTADKANDQEQIVLIRDHLRNEADAFSRGDFSDPARIHGEDMPGLNVLRAGASKVRVAYSDVPSGAQITYTTDDPSLVHALHEWFNAQTSDHGNHAEDATDH